MDRRTFLKTVTHAAAAATAAGLASRAQGASPQRMSLAAVGDCIPGRRISGRSDEPFRAVVDLLRGADCTWGNCEAVIARPGEVYPSFKQSDPYTLCEPWGADELAFMGIDFMGTANNHTMDWGYNGLFSTLEHLERVGIAHAGAGRDLAAASGPGYCDCPAGRVAQVNCSSTFRDYFAAGHSHPDVRGRPGLNPLRVDRITQVDSVMFEKARELLPKMMELRGFAFFADELEELFNRFPEGTVPFGGDNLLKLGDAFDLLSSAEEGDVQRVTESIAVGRNNARVVLATLHAHEARNGLEYNDLFIEPFAHACVDAGADLFYAAGPHVLRGLEIYQGKPIFYGLSNFIFHYENVPVIPADTWTAFGLPRDSRDPSTFAAKVPYPKYERFWRTIVPIVTLEGGTEAGESPRVAEIAIHPVTLGFGEPIWRRGTPELARGEEAESILEEMARLSEPYGTSIAVRDGVGYVDL